MEIPLDSTTNQSKGFMFITLQNSNEAQIFQRSLHGVAFDKRHTFTVIPFSEVDKYESLTEEWVAPQTEEWKPRVSLLRFSFIGLITVYSNRELIFFLLLLFFRVFFL